MKTQEVPQTMTRQDAFDRVWQTFITEKAPPSYRLNEDGELRCQYRGPNQECCSFAVLVPKNQRWRLTEGMAADALFLTRSWLRDLFSEDVDGEFLRALQSTHDDALIDSIDDFHTEMERLLRELAEKYELRIPASTAPTEGLKG